MPSSRPCRRAIATASVRLPAPVFAMIRETWTLAVLGDMNRAWAISWLVRPSASSSSTSASQPVSTSSRRRSRVVNPYRRAIAVARSSQGRAPRSAAICRPGAGARGRCRGQRPQWASASDRWVTARRGRGRAPPMSATPLPEPDGRRDPGTGRAAPRGPPSPPRLGLGRGHTRPLASLDLSATNPPPHGLGGTDPPASRPPR